MITLGIEVLRLLHESVTIPRLDRLLCYSSTQEMKLFEFGKLANLKPVYLKVAKIHQDFLSLENFRSSIVW